MSSLIMISVCCFSGCKEKRPKSRVFVFDMLAFKLFNFNGLVCF